MPKGLRVFGERELASLTREARGGPRQRQHLNLHANAEEPFQRLLNAIEPSAYIRPHRHLLDPKVECLIAVRGSFVVIVFDEAGRLSSAERIGPSAPNCVVEVPAHVWHTVIAESEGSVMFEAKAGPFAPNKAKDLAPWAPDEGSPAVASYLLGLQDSVKSFFDK